MLYLRLPCDSSLVLIGPAIFLLQLLLYMLPLGTHVLLAYYFDTYRQRTRAGSSYAKDSALICYPSSRETHPPPTSCRSHSSNLLDGL